jgi:hypothetical protein
MRLAGRLLPLTPSLGHLYNDGRLSGSFELPVQFEAEGKNECFCQPVHWKRAVPTLTVRP